VVPFIVVWTTPMRTTRWLTSSTHLLTHLRGLYLWSRFGYDVKRNRWRRDSPLPQSERDWSLLWNSRQMWNKQTSLIGAWILGGSEAQASGTDVATGALRRFVDADRMLIWPDGCDTVLCPWLDLRLEAFARFTGTLLARINLSRNHRLRNALASGSLRDQKLELAKRLPGAVWTALKEGGPHEHPKTVMNRAVRLLEYEHAPRRPYRPRKNRLDGEPAPWPEPPWIKQPKYDPLPLIVQMMVEGQDTAITDTALRESGYGTLAENLMRLTPDLLRAISEARGLDVSALVIPVLEQFAAREDAAVAPTIRPLDDELLEAAGALAARHGLSQREAEVFALKGCNWTHAEIGHALGIAVGTSKALLSRASRKVREAM
jgi:hypothetical protein